MKPSKKEVETAMKVVDWLQRDLEENNVYAYISIKQCSEVYSMLEATLEEY